MVIQISDQSNLHGPDGTHLEREARWVEGEVIHDIALIWEGTSPAAQTYCRRYVREGVTIGVNAELPAVSCLLCIQAVLNEDSPLR